MKNLSGLKIKKNGINVLSLFDGISCGQIALNNLKIPISNYYASEIKPQAILCTKYNFPTTIHIGDVKNVSYKNGILITEEGEYESEIDLLIAGSPCQDLSFLKAGGKGLEGEKSKLFYEFFRLLKEVKPKFFLLENVNMKKEYKNIISELLEVEPILIDSSLVSFQKRKRLYWTNIPNVTIPEDENIDFQKYKETNNEVLKKYKLKKTKSRIKMWNEGKNSFSSIYGNANITNAKKIFTITRKQDRSPNSGLIEYEDFCRFLTREELEQGQTLPVGYTKCLSYNQAQDVIGDGWTVYFYLLILAGGEEDDEDEDFVEISRNRKYINRKNRRNGRRNDRRR